MAHPLLKPSTSKTVYPGQQYSTVSSVCKGDVHVPDNGWNKCPAILALHGGGWAAGSRGDMNGPIKYFTDLGFAVATIDYRLSGSAKWPAQIIDVNQAARALLAYASLYRIWNGGYFAWGASAGANLAMLAGSMPQEPVTEPSPRFNPGTNRELARRPLAVQADYGPTNLKRWTEDTSLDLITQWGIDATVQQFLGATPQQRPDLAAEASPTNWASAETAPLYCWHGGADTTVPPDQSQEMVDLVRAAGGQADIEIVPGMPHGQGSYWTRDWARAVAARFEARLPVA